MAKIYSKGSNIYVAGNLTEPILDMWFTEGLIYKMPRRNGLFVAPLSNLYSMLSVAPNLNNDVLNGLVEEELARSVATEDLIRYGVAEDDPEVDELGLWPHQVLGVRLARINKRFGFWFDTRTGKTRMMIQAMYEAISEGRCTRALVICPTSIIPSWLNDFKEFKPELKVAAYYGTDKQKKLALETPCHVFIMSMELTVKNIELLRRIGFKYVVVDESSKLKSHRSQISKTLLDYAPEVDYWYLLSATPAPNNEAEYYIQMRTIDEFIFPPSRTAFVNMYFDNVSRNPAFEKLQIKYNKRADFMDRVKTKSVYIDQSVMPIAGKEWHVYTYEPEAATLAVYNEFRKHAVVELSDAKISTDMVAAVNAKLAQITSGFIIDTDAVNENKLLRKAGERADLVEIYRLDSSYKPSHRAHELYKLLTSLDGQVVIWANYKQEFADIKELLGDECRCINGKTPVADKFEFIRQFKAHKIKYLVCHPLSVGMGINLTEAHHAVYYSLSYSYEALKQSSERICGHITVQPNKCHYWILSAAGTIDEAIYKNVSAKKTTALDFLNALKGDNNEL